MKNFISELVFKAKYVFGKLSISNVVTGFLVLNLEQFKDLCESLRVNLFDLE